MHEVGSLQCMAIALLRETSVRAAPQVFIDYRDKSVEGRIITLPPGLDQFQDIFHARCLVTYYCVFNWLFVSSFEDFYASGGVTDFVL